MTGEAAHSTAWRAAVRAQPLSFDQLSDSTNITGAFMKTLFLQAPSYDGFDGGAGSRYQAKREIR